jgi:hypothetical protein
MSLRLLCFRYIVWRVPILDAAKGLLHETEEKLREMVSVAAKSGDYASVLQIASWAQTVTVLLSARGAKAPASQSNLSGKRVGGEIKAILQARSSRRAGMEYPQFFRRNDQLIRLAWSRREHKEYIHKAPYVVFKALAKTMAEQGAGGRLFSTDDFLPLHDKGGGAVPNYQAYVGIALLKRSGLIDQHGRQGYSIPRLAEFEGAVEAVWRKLPERH